MALWLVALVRAVGCDSQLLHLAFALVRWWSSGALNGPIERSFHCGALVVASMDLSWRSFGCYFTVGTAYGRSALVGTAFVLFGTVDALSSVVLRKFDNSGPVSSI